ncbi:uncharacterized protein LOC135848284 [Planococcus citri]|uniref:uncharacterized protein LOC135848284 n=1 Tax=Planococcus citri TaxID=170843 RepID=UPI0031F7903A
MFSQIKMIGVYLMIINVVCGIDSEYESRTNENEFTNTEDELSNSEEEIGSGDNTTDLSKCRRVTLNTSSAIFYPIEEMKNEGGFFIKFNAKANLSANLLFSQENNFTKCTNDDDVTKNCIMVTIRSSSEKKYLASTLGNGTHERLHYEKNLLSSKEWRQFWIRITSDGSLIEVGKKGSPPFMAYRTQPWTLNYYGMFAFDDEESISYAFLCFENNKIDLSQYRTLTTYDHVYTFYSIDGIKNDEGFFLEFMVKTDQDAHIIFSPTNETVKKDQRVFEVILGGYTTNTISVIKTTELAEPAKEHHEKDILSPDEWRPFWIRITPDGASIQVGKKGSSAFMSLKTEPRPIKYYGFASSDSFANWAFPGLEKNNIGTNVCIPSPCGPNSECKQKNNRVICSCKKNQLDSPSTCRFECIFNSECPQNEACIGKRCENPCDGMCDKNATCEVDSHVPICSCLDGFTGDPLAGCVEEEDLPKYRSLTTHSGETFYPTSVIKNDDQIFLKFNVKPGRIATISLINDVAAHDDRYFSVIFSSEKSEISIAAESIDLNLPRSFVTYTEHNLLSNKEWRPFWIRITSDGSLIEIGKNIGKLAFVSVKKDPWPIKYFGFMSTDVCHWNFVSSKDTNLDLLRYRTLTSYSTYSTLYPIADINNDDEFFLEFNVKAIKFAQIIFTEKNDPKITAISKNDTMYQDLDIFHVVIDGTHLAIRTTPAGEEQVRYDEKNLISSKEWRQFWIRITTDGSSIEVGKNGGRTLASLKTKPRIIKYFGLAGDEDYAGWAFPPQKAKFLVFL